MEDKNKELQELDDMLSELHDLVEDVPEVEPDEELQQLLDLPEITVTPVVIKAPEVLMTEESTEAKPDAESVPDAALEGATVAFSPVAEETSPKTEEPSAESELEETRRIPDVDSAPTQKIPPVAEPAFDVPEELTPPPILFAPRSRLKELKKDLVAGPEKRYYSLSEIGTGRLQIALLLNVLVGLVCIAAAGGDQRQKHGCGEQQKMCAFVCFHRKFSFLYCCCFCIRSHIHHTS